MSDISEVTVSDLSNARPDIRVIRTDVGNEAQIDDMFTRAEKHLGGLDVLINNAGIAGPTMAAEGISLTDWAVTFDVNVTGHFLYARRAIRLMKAQKSGSIVNMPASELSSGVSGR